MIRRRLFAAALAAMIGAACGPMSDGAAYQRQVQKERKSRLRGMKAATAQTARGRDVAGEELRDLVRGKTHVSEYESGPSGTPGLYIEYSYFQPDGHFVYMNSLWAVDPNGNEGDAWRVDGDRLCIRNSSFSSDEQCYRLAVTAEGRVQYYIAQPGEDTDGLLTKVPNRVLDGPPPAKAAP